MIRKLDGGSTTESRDENTSETIGSRTNKLDN